MQTDLARAGKRGVHRGPYHIMDVGWQWPTRYHLVRIKHKYLPEGQRIRIASRRHAFQVMQHKRDASMACTVHPPAPQMWSDENLPGLLEWL
jgi:hypothetical protein